ncbi:hypothetical protein V6U81_17685 [Micromonospora sp. CPCC 205711]|uniref:hypothetical protein n=1 Tax=Micromonospora sp. CPCC 205547 TaxID=3122400 RepID=UPI002FF0A01F
MRGMTGRGAAVAAGTMLAAALLAGCGWAEGEDAETLARREARGRLDEVITVIERVRPWEADEFGRIVHGRTGLELMSLEGVDRAGGVSLVVRTHGEATTTDWSGSDSGHADVTLCHRLVYRTDEVQPVTEVDCPTTAPVTPRPAATLPPDLTERLRRELPTGPAATEASVGAYLDRPRLDSRVRRDVASYGGSVGLALRADRRGSCLLARVVGDKVEVWSPSPVQLQPGELTCSGRTAAAGQGQRSPH